ncbi:ATP-binding protein [Methanomassiliicoccaceae archaeon COG_1]|nr:ATP-binding protein [Methanomassiliicoccaceae archaeon COG_1]
MDGYLVRERYLGKMRAGRGDTDVIKVITGMRRCGKSVLLELYAEELRGSGVPEEDIIHINFERFEYQNVTDRERLNALLSERTSRERLTYVLLDEIQNVKGWELSLSGLEATGRCDVYVTGSNSSMLSSQLATHIAGRHVEIRVYPLSFGEFTEMHGYTDRERAFAEFLECGGLPGVDPSRDSRYREDYLQGVYNTILVKDVLRHANVGDPSKVESIARFLFSNIGNVTNRSSVARETGLPESTVGIYLKAMEDAFLILPCDRYDMVGRKLLSTNGKYYVTDLGIRKAVLDIAAGTDISRPLENVVYVELLRRGYKVRTGSYRDSAVDFLASRYGSTEYFQVCQTLMSEGTRGRETRTLMRPDDNYPKTVLTLDRLGLGNECGIMIKNVIDWLAE